MPDREIHPLCSRLRELRRAAGLSLQEAEEHTGVHAVVLGSYERGDRNPPLNRIEEIFNKYGYTIEAVPIGPHAVRVPENIAAELHAIANHLEGNHAMSKVLRPSPA
jgi:transcriptional regulator with XRE-family HTH domain